MNRNALALCALAILTILPTAAAGPVHDAHAMFIGPTPVYVYSSSGLSWNEEATVPVENGPAPTVLAVCVADHNGDQVSEGPVFNDFLEQLPGGSPVDDEDFQSGTHDAHEQDTCTPKVGV